MRDNLHIYGGFSNVEPYGLYQRYCDIVGTSGMYVDGIAEIAAAYFISRPRI